MSEDPVPEGRDSGVNSGHVAGAFVVAPRCDTGQNFVTRSTHHWATTVARQHAQYLHQSLCLQGLDLQTCPGLMRIF